MYLKGIYGLPRFKHKSYLTGRDYVRLDDDTLLELVTLYIKIGDEDARNKIINSHMPLAFDIASKYSYRVRNRVDDLQSEAVLALVEAVDKARVKIQDNIISPYINSYIHGKLSLYLRHDSTVYIPPAEVKRRSNVNAKKLTYNTFAISLPDIDNLAYVDIDDSPVTEQYTVDECQYDIDESMKRLNKQEQTVLSYRLIGYNDPQIGVMLSVSKERIRQVREQIKKKFNGIWFNL